jgi:hypothetical protein
VTDEDEWVDAEWVVRQDAETASPGVLTHGLADRVGAEPSLPLNASDRLEQAISDLVVAFDEGELDVEDTTDGTAGAHLVTYRVHLSLRRSQLNLVENAVATALGFLGRDGAQGLASALELLQTLISAASWLSATERNAVSSVLMSQRCGVAMRRDDAALDGVDVQNLVDKGVLAENEDGLSVSA